MGNTLWSSVWAAFCTVLFCELICFLLAAILCDKLVSFDTDKYETTFSNLNGLDYKQPKSILLLSDIHLLGERRRFLVDRLWTDWQLWKSYWALELWFQPYLVICLGDHLDEGDIINNQVFERQVDRLNSVLGFRDIENRARFIMNVIGNHDGGNYRSMDNTLVNRFEYNFGAVNKLIKHDDMEYVVVNGIGLDKASKRSSFVRNQVIEFFENLPNKTGFRVLLLHLPLFRENDLVCGLERLRERGHVTYEAPETKLKEREDVLSNFSSNIILEKVMPDLVISGHTHAQCRYKRGSPLRRTAISGSSGALMELTLPSFSWRMRPDPGFGILRIHEDHNEFKTKICKLPNENFIFFCYLCLLAYCIFIWARSLRSHQKHKQR